MIRAAIQALRLGVVAGVGGGRWVGGGIGGIAGIGRGEWAADPGSGARTSGCERGARVADCELGGRFGRVAAGVNGSKIRGGKMEDLYRQMN